MIRVPLTQGKFAIIDYDDAWLLEYKWCVVWGSKRRTHAYARAIVDGKPVLMHRLIVKAERGVPVDHRDGNTLDNRRGNLRTAKPVENSQNRLLPQRGTASGFKGVHIEKRSGLYRVRITKDARVIYLGSYRDAGYAATVYDRNARILFGEFATLNFPKEGERSCK